ncbi:MAG: AAA family ATPase, partial [Chloroflexi bacterium]
MDPEVVKALEVAIAANPRSVGLRVHLARVLLDGGDAEGALRAVSEALALEPADGNALAVGESAARALGDETRAAGYRALLDALGRPPGGPPSPGVPDSSGFSEIVQREFGEAPSSERVTPEFVRSEWEVERPSVTLSDVAGMEAVKRRLEMGFLAPLRNPEAVQAYRMSLRGGMLLYGPPGCGKTFLARATAGELGARFMAVGLSDVLDMWLGESERKLHEIFEEARRNAPCVLFFDEVDAIGQKRSQLRTAPGLRYVVNQLLAELDGVATSNEGVFIVAATNHPW